MNQLETFLSMLAAVMAILGLPGLLQSKKFEKSKIILWLREINKSKPILISLYSFVFGGIYCYAVVYFTTQFISLSWPESSGSLTLSLWGFFNLLAVILIWRGSIYGFLIVYISGMAGLLISIWQVIGIPDITSEWLEKAKYTEIISALIHLLFPAALHFRYRSNKLFWMVKSSHINSQSNIVTCLLMLPFLLPVSSFFYYEYSDNIAKATAGDEIAKMVIIAYEMEEDIKNKGSLSVLIEVAECKCTLQNLELPKSYYHPGNSEEKRIEIASDYFTKIDLAVLEVAMFSYYTKVAKRKYGI